MRQTTDNANDSTNQPSYRLEISRLAIFLSLIFSIFVIPYDVLFYLFEEYRGLLFSSFACLFLGMVIRFRKFVPFTNIDFFWLMLIGYSFLSTSWANNIYAAFYGSFISLLLYIFFKIFQQQEKSQSFERNFRVVVFTAFSLGMLYEIILLHQDCLLPGNKKILVFDIFKTNFNYISCIITILFSFILFHEWKRFSLLKYVVILLALYTVYLSDSAMAFLVMLGLTVYFITQKFIKNKFVSASLFLLITIISIGGIYYFAQDKDTRKASYILQEMTSQNDRLTLYKNTLDVVSKTPFLGFGKSNWKYRYGENGFNDYVYMSKSNLSFQQFNHSHNMLIEKISELGIVGSLILFVLIVVLFFHLFSNLKSFSDFDWQIIYALIAYYLCAMIYGIPYNASLQFNPIPVFVFALLGLLFSNHANYSRQRFTGNKILFSVSMISLLFFGMHFYSKSKLASGKIHFQNKQYAEALTDFKSANVLVSIGEANYWIGNTQWKLGNKEEAIRYLNKALSASPYSIDRINRTAQVCLENKNYDNALKLANQSNELLTINLTSDFLRLMCLQKLNKEKEFRKEVVKYQEKLSNLEKAFRKYEHVPKLKKKADKFLERQMHLKQYLHSLKAKGYQF